MVTLSLGQMVRIVREDENSIDHNCEGKIIGMQIITDGSLVYLVQATVNCQGTECNTVISVRAGEYELVEESFEGMDINDFPFEN
jgi:hypothetical protein